MNKKHVLIISFSIFALLILVVLYNSGIKSSANKDEVYTYLENTYGFSDEIVYAEYTASISKDGNKKVNKSNGHFKEDSKGGVIYYKNIEKDDLEQLICIYLDEATYNNISVNCTISEKKQEGNTKSKTLNLAMPHLKSRCYVTVEGSYLITVELAEKNEGWVDGYYYLSYDWNKSSFDSSDNLEYEESIKVYDLDDECNEVINITRTINPKQDGEIKECEISMNGENYKYISGISYVDNGAFNMIDTEQAFCDMANNILSENEIDWVKFNRTCWENRWYRLEIDETDIPDEISKIDFSTTFGKLKNDTVSSDIVIAMNSEKEEKGKLIDEGVDEPIVYISENTSSDQTTSFDIDGYWYSPDYRYVYRIYTKQSDGGFNDFCYTNIKSGAKHIHYGTIQQTSTYGITLKPREENKKTRELIIDGQMLKSDDFILCKTDENIANNIIGTWKDGDVTYLFEDNGEYKYKDSKKSYWGFYFVIDENQVVLGKYSGELKLNEYSIESNELKINNKSGLKRQ